MAVTFKADDSYDFSEKSNICKKGSLDERKWFGTSSVEVGAVIVKGGRDRMNMSF